MSHEHILCKGELVFCKKEGKKTLYRCLKCDQIINCILCYSYDEMVKMGIVTK